MEDLPLYHLPVKHRALGGESEVMRTYVEELQRVTNPEELIAHVDRWHRVWEMTRHKYPTDPLIQAETELLDGTWKERAGEIWECVQAGRTGVCKHSEQDCPSVHILLPVPFVQMFLVAKEFQMPMDIALERIYGDGRGF
jgi:hypothetical protein